MKFVVISKSDDLGSIFFILYLLPFIMGEESTNQIW